MSLVIPTAPLSVPLPAVLCHTNKQLNPLSVCRSVRAQRQRVRLIRESRVHAPALNPSLRRHFLHTDAYPNHPPLSQVWPTHTLDLPSVTMTRVSVPRHHWNPNGWRVHLQSNTLWSFLPIQKDTWSFLTQSSFLCTPQPLQLLSPAHMLNLCSQPICPLTTGTKCGIPHQSIQTHCSHYDTNIHTFPFSYSTKSGAIRPASAGFPPTYATD